MKKYIILILMLLLLPAIAAASQIERRGVGLFDGISYRQRLYDAILDGVVTFTGTVTTETDSRTVVLPQDKNYTISTVGEGAFRANSPLYLYQHTPVTLTGTTTETVLWQGTITANALGKNGVLRITHLWSYTNSANTKNLRVRFDGIGGTVFFNNAASTTNSTQSQTIIRNRNSTSSQIGFASGSANSFSTSTGNPITSSINTTGNVLLVLTGQLGTSTETIQLESVDVELLKP